MKRHSPLLIPLALLAAAGCTDEVPMVNLGIDEVYYIPRMSKLPLESALTGKEYPGPSTAAP